MTAMEIFVYLFSKYQEGGYKTADFCDLFTGYYNSLELPSLSVAGEEWMDHMDRLCNAFPKEASEEEIKAFAENFSLKTLLTEVG